MTQAHRDAVEVNEALLQGMVAAMWSLEGGRHEDALRTLRDTVRLGHRQVSRLLRDAHMGPAGVRGRLLLPRERPHECGRESKPA